MKEARSIEEVRSIVSQWRREGLSVGLVPTMGYLHEGHCSLIERAAAENDRVVVSIFVNPAQFDRKEDLEKYPVDIEGDAMAIARHHGNLVFIPEALEIYPSGFSTVVEVEKLDNELCGATRPGHFRGVCTIVNKLFNIVQPDKAYFGEKDYQQLAIIKRMVKDLNIPVEVVGCPIVRSADGLALSSRNARLSPEEREDALIINKALTELRSRVEGGTVETAKLIEGAVKKIHSVPGTRVDYFEVVDAVTLEKIDRVESEALAATAVFIGKVRLIDNIKLK